MLELSLREKDACVKPDPDVASFMKAIALVGLKASLATDCILKAYFLNFSTKI